MQTIYGVLVINSIANGLQATHIDSRSPVLLCVRDCKIIAGSAESLLTEVFHVRH